MAGEPRRPGVPEVLVLAGCVLAIAGNMASLAWLLGDVPAGWLPNVSLHLLGLAASATPPVLLLAWRGRTPRRFVLLAIVATAVALLTFGGLPGGLVALAGAVWGLLATYEPLPERT